MSGSAFAVVEIAFVSVGSACYGIVLVLDSLIIYCFGCTTFAPYYVLDLAGHAHAWHECHVPTPVSLTSTSNSRDIYSYHLPPT